MKSIERFIDLGVDLGYELVSRYISHKTGRPTAVEKQIVEGPRVNGVIRPDLPDGAPLSAQLAAQTGKLIFVVYRTREVRRKIVFLDEVSYEQDSRSTAHQTLAKTIIDDDLRRGATSNQLQTVKSALGSNNGIDIARRTLQSYGIAGTVIEIANLHQIDISTFSAKLLRDAIIQKVDGFLALSPKEQRVYVSDLRKPQKITNKENN